MEVDLIESLRTQHGFQELPESGRPLLQVTHLELSDFSINKSAFVQALVLLYPDWYLSVVNIGLMVMPFITELDNKWEIALLYKNEIFPDIHLFNDVFELHGIDWRGDSIIQNLNLDTVNALIPDLKERLKGGPR